MKKGYFYSVLDGAIQGVIICLLSQYFFSIYMVEPVEMNIIVILTLIIISVISFLFLILHKTKEMIRIKLAVSIISFLAVIFLDFINIMTLNITDGIEDVIVEIELLDCCLAYCSNCHKTQGATIKNVFVYHTSDWVDNNMMLSAQWLYTAYTRAKSFLSIHTDEYSNISKGVRKNAIDEKCTIIELLMK